MPAREWCGRLILAASWVCVGLTLGAQPARAQGCVAARMSAPVLGMPEEFSKEHPWSVALSWRHQTADRHFTGTHEDATKAQGGQVTIRLDQIELAVTRTFTPRWSLAVGLPYLNASHSSPIRDPFAPDDAFGNDPVVLHSRTQARGPGDVNVVPRYWVLDPAKHQNHNIALGLGIKLPTGADNVHDTRLRRDTTPTPPNTFQVESVEQNVDQSIQPGDGGFGAVLDLQAFYRFAQNRGAVYLSGTYLANPRNTNGVPTYRTNPGEEVLSVNDQYLYRVGATWFPRTRVGLSLGGRIEGVPAHDLIGGSDGFRRPGYAVSVEPGWSYTRGVHTVSLMLPWAVIRNRTRSVPEIANGDHGDAAFADYVVLAGYIRRF